MNLERVDQIARAVLYEGYMLYPYRPSSVKNRQRFNFGVVYPQAYSQAQGEPQTSEMQVECLVSDNRELNNTRKSKESLLTIKLRFLQIQMRTGLVRAPSPNNSSADNWQEAIEREVTLPASVLENLHTATVQDFAFSEETQIDSEYVRRNAAIAGTVELRAQKIHTDLFKVKVQVRNTTALNMPVIDRDEVLMHSLVSTHLILGIEGAEFVSLLEPPPEFAEAAAQCQHFGAFPVLVGEPGQRDMLLASPIILYDYPQIAAESAGDLFDGTEIDEILSLRIMTLTDEEKKEIRNSDERARQILKRTDSMPTEQFMKLHGALRGLRPVKEDTA
ncbi:MAG: hypothetical protein WBS24_13185 [Terriglobales bacterium]